MVQLHLAVFILATPLWASPTKWTHSSMEINRWSGQSVDANHSREKRQLKTCPGFPGFCSESFPGTTCLVICSFGRNNVPECQEDGTWTDIPRCIEHEPGIPEQLPGVCPGIPGYCSQDFPGGFCQFDCMDGPDIRSTCTPDGTWEPYPTCQGDLRETRDGCSQCPGPNGGPRNREEEALEGGGSQLEQPRNIDHGRQQAGIGGGHQGPDQSHGSNIRQSWRSQSRGQEEQRVPTRGQDRPHAGSRGDNRGHFDRSNKKMQLGERRKEGHRVHWEEEEIRFINPVHVEKPSYADEHKPVWNHGEERTEDELFENPERKFRYQEEIRTNDTPHSLSSTIEDFPLLSAKTEDFPTLSKTFENFPSLSKITEDQSFRSIFGLSPVEESITKSSSAENSLFGLPIGEGLPNAKEMHHTPLIENEKILDLSQNKQINVFQLKEGTSKFLGPIESHIKEVNRKENESQTEGNMHRLFHVENNRKNLQQHGGNLPSNNNVRVDNDINRDQLDSDINGSNQSQFREAPIFIPGRRRNSQRRRQLGRKRSQRRRPQQRRHQIRNQQEKNLIRRDQHLPQRNVRLQGGRYDERSQHQLQDNRFQDQQQRDRGQDQLQRDSSQDHFKRDRGQDQLPRGRGQDHLQRVRDHDLLQRDRSQDQIEKTSENVVNARISCPREQLEACVDICPGFNHIVYGACVAGCSKRCNRN